MSEWGGGPCVLIFASVFGPTLVSVHAWIYAWAQCLSAH